MIQLKYDFFLTLFDLYIEKKTATTFNTNSIIYDLEIIKNAEFHFWKIIELQGIKKQLFCIFSFVDTLLILNGYKLEWSWD